MTPNWCEPSSVCFDTGMMDSAVAPIPTPRLVLWFAGIAIVQAVLLLPFAGWPTAAQGGVRFAVYVSGSTAMAVAALAMVPALAANARTAAGVRALWMGALVALAGGLIAGALVAEDAGFHPVALIIAASFLVLASVPFFLELIGLLIAEWYFRLPKRPG